MDHALLKQIVEALIFASDEPLSESRIRSCIEDVDGQSLETIIESLNEEYHRSGRSFRIVKVAGGFQFATQPAFSKWIKRLYQGRSRARLTQASLEVLAIVAFQQPVSRTEIDAVRGVNSVGVLRNLMERRLITIAGRAEGVGRPLLYKTTDEFLRYFGINDISDLPKPKEIEEILGSGEVSDQVVEALALLEEQQQSEGGEATPQGEGSQDGEPEEPPKNQDAAE